MMPPARFLSADAAATVSLAPSQRSDGAAKSQLPDIGDQCWMANVTLLFNVAITNPSTRVTGDQR